MLNVIRFNDLGFFKIAHLITILHTFQSLNSFFRIKYEEIRYLRQYVVILSNLFKIFKYLIELQINIFISSGEKHIALCTSTLSFNWFLIGNLGWDTLLTEHMITRKEQWLYEYVLAYGTSKLFAQSLVKPMSQVIILTQAFRWRLL